MGDRFGLDIGTSNIRISCADTGKILSEKNVIAVRDGRYIIGYCNEAYEMFEKAPENVDVVFPVIDSVISDSEKMQLILEYMYKKINGGKLKHNSDFLIAVPTDTTEVEKRAFHELVATSKIHPRTIYVIEKSIADAVSCDIDVKSPKGNIIVNIGADTTDISVVSMGGIVLTRTMKIAGNKLNEVIMNTVRHQQDRLIGWKSADQIKLTLTDLGPDPEPKEITLFSRVMETGLPARTTISSDIINPVLAQTLEPLVDMVKSTLEKTPPELAADIIDNGIYLLGGTTNIKNIDVMFARETGLKIKTMVNPENSTIRGVTKVLAGGSRYDSVKHIPMEKIYN